MVINGFQYESEFAIKVMQSLPFFIASWTQFIFWRKLFFFFFPEGCSNLGLFHQQCKQNQDHNSLLQYGILWLTPNCPIIFLYELQVRELYARLRNFSENHDLSQMLNLLPILHWTSLLFHIKLVWKILLSLRTFFEKTMCRQHYQPFHFSSFFSMNYHLHYREQSETLK